MTVPYDRIRSRVDCQAVPCLLCERVTIQQVVDHCHEHGWTRGILCVACNNRMARVDADPRHATAAELFHRDNCPECRREGFAGLASRMAAASHSTRARNGAGTGSDGLRKSRLVERPKPGRKARTETEVAELIEAARLALGGQRPTVDAIRTALKVGTVSARVVRDRLIASDGVTGDSESTLTAEGGK